MIIIDASNVNSGGGKILLEYLLDQLISKSIDFVLLKDIRWKGYLLPDGCISIITSNFTRKRILKKYAQLYSPRIVFCFGNFPPPLKLNAKTITYFHNPNLFDSLKNQFWNDRLFFLKKIYLVLFLKNTDIIVFQNNKILFQFKKIYGWFLRYDTQLLDIAFFDDKKIKNFKKDNPKIEKVPNSFIYVSLPHNHKNHKTLLDAWEVLAREQNFPLLTLTIPDYSISIVERIKLLQSQGLNIKNIGLVSFNEALKQTAQSDFCIFPSLKETFGLGLIEGALLGGKVLAANLDYVYEVVEPSLVFDALNPHSIADTVKFCLTNRDKIPETIPIIQNKIEILLDLFK